MQARENSYPLVNNGQSRTLTGWLSTYYCSCSSQNSYSGVSMKSMLGMCFNWKVLAFLGIVGAAVLVIAPGAALAVLPLLLLAACPLSKSS